jgi:hypothetical protein
MRHVQSGKYFVDQKEVCKRPVILKPEQSPSRKMSEFLFQKEIPRESNIPKATFKFLLQKFNLPSISYNQRKSIQAGLTNRSRNKEAST